MLHFAVCQVANVQGERGSLQYSSFFLLGWNGAVILADIVVLVPATVTPKKPVIPLSCSTTVLGTIRMLLRVAIQFISRAL